MTHGIFNGVGILKVDNFQGQVVPFYVNFCNQIIDLFDYCFRAYNNNLIGMYDRKNLDLLLLNNYLFS